jgi:hypothetical protein
MVIRRSLSCSGGSISKKLCGMPSGCSAMAWASWGLWLGSELSRGSCSSEMTSA